MKLLGQYSPAFCWQRVSWVTFTPSEARSCFIHIHCCRHMLSVPTWQLARWCRCRVSLFTNCCQAPKHLGESRESAGANNKDCSYSHLPHARHTTWASHFTSLGLSYSSVKWGCYKDLTPSPLGAWMASAASYLATCIHSSQCFYSITRVIFVKSQIKSLYSPAKILQWQLV